MPVEVTTGEPELNPNVPAEVPTEARLTPPAALVTILNARRYPLLSTT